MNIEIPIMSKIPTYKKTYIPYKLSKMEKNILKEPFLY